MMLLERIPVRMSQTTCEAKQCIFVWGLVVCVGGIEGTKCVREGRREKGDNELTPLNYIY